MKGASVSKELERVHAVAREKKGERFTALFHHVNVARLRRAFEQMSKDAAPGPAFRSSSDRYLKSFNL